jgi:hypothetical protein
MRKLITATTVCALAVGLAAAPSAIAKKGPKLVSGTVTVTASPTTVDETNTGVVVTGNVKANSSCRKDRIVRFSYTSGMGVVTPSAVAVETGPNGDYTATLERPPLVDGTTTVTATVDQQFRKVGSKKKGKKTKKGRKFNCLEITGTSNQLAVSDGLP